MANWFKARWRAFQSSYDADEAAAGSSFAGTVLATVSMFVVIASLAYLPQLAPSVQFRRPWIALGLIAAGAVTTSIARRYRCRGRAGTCATLLDNVFWSSAILYSSVNTAEKYAVGLALANAMLVLFVTVRFYSLTFLFGVVLVAPSALLVAVFRPSGAVVVLLVSTVVLALFIANTTAQHRGMVRRRQQLEQALGVADKVADESMQAALATMLLSLGHFLHELRNYQTAIATNLSYLEATSDLNESASEALADVKEVQAAEQKLIYRTIEELKQRSRPVLTTFDIREPLRQAAAEQVGIRIHLNAPDKDFRLQGNPEHLQVVLHNLIRNSVQAGATEVHMDLYFEASGQAVKLLVHDDGPGISVSRREQMFQPFGDTSKLEGTGLGLYLCRRYVGLFGGTVAVEEGPLGGAAFVIRLPGTAPPPVASMNDRSQSVPAA